MRCRGTRLTRPRSPLCLFVMAALAVTLTLGLTGCGDDDQSVQEAVDQILEETDSLLNQSYDIKVTDMVNPFPAIDDLYMPQPGNKWVKLTVSVANTAEPDGGYMPLVASFTDFKLEASDGQKYSNVLVTVEDDFGASRSPAAGETETGAFVFEIPEGTEPVALWESVGGDPVKVDLPG